MGSLMTKVFFKSGIDKFSTVTQNKTSLPEIALKDINGLDTTLSSYLSNKKAIIFVNVACSCGLTSDHYSQLQELYDKYEGKGLQILGFPCNQFMNQESKIESEIKEYVKNKFDAKFPLFAKIEVNGANTHPLYVYLKSNTEEFVTKEGLKNIPWNFAKFLVDSNGKVVKYFSPKENPVEMIGAIEKLL